MEELSVVTLLQEWAAKAAAAMLALYMMSLYACLSVRLSQAGIVSKRMDKSSWFWHGGFFPLIPHCVIRKFGYLQGYFPLELRPKLRA